MPRQILPRTTYLLTRRTVLRQFLLRPSKLTVQIFMYCLGVAAKKYHLVLHALCVLSNHYHLVATDQLGMLPAFEAWLNEHVAKAVNASLGRWEALWSQGSYVAQSLEAPEDVLEAMTYVAINPVKAGLVARCDLWPGINILPSSLGRNFSVGRPPVFFRADGNMPDEVELEFVMPPAYGLLAPEAFRVLWFERIVAETKRLKGQLEAAGRRIMGRRAVLDQNPFESAESWEKRRNLKPRIKCLEKWRRIELIKRLQQFCAGHRKALEQFRGGKRDVVFPAGTYWMRIHAGVRCAPG